MTSTHSSNTAEDLSNSDTLFGHRPFLLFWIARVFSAIAFQVSAVAVGWQVYALTGSAFNLGLVGLFQFLPMIVLSLVAGHVADRYDRRAIVRTCQAVMGLSALGLAVGDFTGWIHIAGIFSAIAVIGAARSFEHPTMAALLPGLVPSSLFPKAAALTSSAIQTAFIIGPALGGFLYTAGPTVAYAAAALLFLSAGLLASFIRVDRVPPGSNSRDFRSIFSGITFIRSRPALLGAISLDLFAVLFGGATALLPIFARDILHTGPLGLGVLRSAPAAGALAMSVLLARFPLTHGIGHRMFGAVIVFGLATIIVCPVYLDDSFTGFARRSRCGGCDQHGYTNDTRPALDSGRNARQGERRQLRFCGNV